MRPTDFGEIANSRGIHSFQFTSTDLFTRVVNYLPPLPSATLQIAGDKCSGQMARLPALPQRSSLPPLLHVLREAEQIFHFKLRAVVEHERA